MDNVLIIGGAGYIGSHQVKLMCELNYNVFVLDNLSTGYKESVDKRAKLIIGDIRDKKLLLQIFAENNIDSVIHFAALSLVGESQEKPLEYYNNNVYGMQILLEAMIEADVNKIIFSSSAAVYGEHEKMPIDETYETNPTSVYGETKLMMEKMIASTSKVHNIKYVSLRYFNVAGASLDGSIGEAHNPETHLIPNVIKNMINNKSLKVFGNDYPTPDGTCIRDYVHVLDLVDSHKLALDYLNCGGKSDIFNVGYNNGYSIMEILKASEKVIESKVDFEICDRRSGDPAVLISNNQKIINTIKWCPKYNNVDIIIQSAYNWHIKHK